MKKSRKMALLLLPLLIGYLFQATQYARAPVKYSYYIVYAKNADIAILSGSDLSPEDGNYLLRNSTQQGLYNLSLGEWAPGYRVNYSDAFHIKNNQAFEIILITVNFSSISTGTSYLNLYMKNDTDGDGNADGGWILVWQGCTYNETHWLGAGTGNQLSASYFIRFVSGAELPVKIEIVIPETGVAISQSTPSILYEGTLYLWFTSTY
jgi:hypothetical protein